jgi:phytoene dehydrogenase-like protein
MAAHSVLSLESTVSSAAALVLMAAGHANGWPIVEGGAQSLSDLLMQQLERLGGSVTTSDLVKQLPESELILADITPRQFLEIAGSAVPDWYRKRLIRFRYGAGTFKVDYALNEPIPWRAKDCARAATVHLGGTLEQIVRSERTFDTESPFVLLVQPSLFDGSRAPAGKHTAWAYCHVPAGSAVDRLHMIERQIERFAPGFRECVAERRISTPAMLERWNPNLVGGELSGGVMNLRQMICRPTLSRYRTPARGIFLCSASTPPGPGVHGMCGFHAAYAALRSLG